VGARAEEEGAGPQQITTRQSVGRRRWEVGVGLQESERKMGERRGKRVRDLADGGEHSEGSEGPNRLRGEEADTRGGRRQIHDQSTNKFLSFCLHFVLFRSRDSMHASRNELYVVGSIETSGVQTATLTSFWWKIHIHFSNWNLIIFDANFLSFLCMKERALLPDYDLYT
jgi:hypothetical protein